MKSLSLFVFVLTFSFSVHASTDKKKTDHKGISERRHYKAREILKNNFEAFEQIEEKKNEKPNFGFKKNEKENDQSL